jgi:polyisoprenoid-binding protein YceI
MSYKEVRMATTTWQIDSAHSRNEFSVKHMMFTTVRGRFTRFSGTIRADEQNPDNSAAEVEIDASSIDTGTADRDTHLRSADFFDVQNYPTITFRSTGVSGAHATDGDRFEVSGTLTIRGTAVPVTLRAVFEGKGMDPWGKQRAGFTAKAEIDRRQWGLTYNQALETGGILVGNTINIEADLQAVKQEAGQAVA